MNKRIRKDPHPFPSRWKGEGVVLHAFAAVVLLTMGGCQLAVNPFKDELANQPTVTTPSVAAVIAANKEPHVVARPYAPTTAPAVDGTVDHLPLCFEDWFEDTERDEGRFAWTGWDYIHILSWRGRFLVNLMGFPLTVVMTPPWQAMYSDGHAERRDLGLQYDAARAATDEQQPESDSGDDQNDESKTSSGS